MTGNIVIPEIDISQQDSSGEWINLTSSNFETYVTGDNNGTASTLTILNDMYFVSRDDSNSQYYNATSQFFTSSFVYIRAGYYSSDSTYSPTPGQSTYTRIELGLSGGPYFYATTRGTYGSGGSRYTFDGPHFISGYRALVKVA